MTDSHGIDYNHIADGIFIGTNQCCQVHFDSQVRMKEHIDADISLESERVDAPFGVSFYLWLPVEDHHAPHQHQLTVGVDLLCNFVQLRKHVYVHCKNGHGRAPTLVAGYLIRKGMTVENALTHLSQQRPSIHLTDSQQEALKVFYEQYTS